MERNTHFDTPVAGRTEISPEILAAATLITGQTGCGKTWSYVAPMCKGLLRYQSDGLLAGGLMIDPKSELLAMLQRMPDLAPRLRLIGDKGNRINFFEFLPDCIGVDGRFTALMRIAYSGDRDRSFRSIVTGCAASNSCAAQIVFWKLRTTPNQPGFLTWYWMFVALFSNGFLASEARQAVG